MNVRLGRGQACVILPHSPKNDGLRVWSAKNASDLLKIMAGV